MEATPASHPAPLAVVTGASSGIGRLTATLLAQRGYRTLLIARRKSLLDSLTHELSRYAPSVAMALDLSATGTIVNEVSQALADLGTASVLINNAGYNQFGRFIDKTSDQHERIIRVNYLAAAEMIRAVLPGMQSQGRGHVINVASMATKVGPWGHGAYAAAKSALVSLTETLAAEYVGTRIHFCYINPGLVKTPYFEDPSYAAMRDRLVRHGIDPSLVAQRIVHLIDRPRLETCVPWHYRLLDIIRAISPTLAHKLVTNQSTPPQQDEIVTTATPQPGHSGD